MNLFSLYSMMALYILAGLNHFRVPRVYEPMIPPWFPQRQFMVFLSGAAEIALGLLLFFDETRALAAWGIVAMLTVFFIVHFYMLKERNGIFKKIPNIILILRLPFQFVLIYWAYTLT